MRQRRGRLSGCQQDSRYSSRPVSRYLLGPSRRRARRCERAGAGIADHRAGAGQGPGACVSRGALLGRRAAPSPRRQDCGPGAEVQVVEQVSRPVLWPLGTIDLLEQINLKSRTALITGASRGLGKSMALALGSAGARLALVGRDAEALARVADEARRGGADAEPYRVDVTDEQQVLDLERKVLERFGPVHILINNAGINIRKNVPEFTLQE